MFIGQYITKLTEKNRTALPKKFRDELGNNAIIARWYEGCLVIVSLDAWKALLDRLTGKSELITQPVRDTDRFILGSAFEIEFDAQGRFVIPKVLKDYAGLGSDVVFAGLGARIELWDEKAWAERESFVSDHAAEMIEKLSNQNMNEGFRFREPSTRRGGEVGK